MFKSEAKLFLNGKTKMDSAQSIINECKRIIGQIQLQGNADYTKCKSNIIDCDVDGLANKIEQTRKSLMQLDPDFSNEYMKLLAEYFGNTSIDTSNMNEQEKMQYGSYLKDYNYNVLYMFERLEKNGELTPELEEMLLREYGVTYEMQKAIVEKSDIQNQMSSIVETDQKYIDLFKKYAECEKNIINSNINLTAEEKANYLRQYDINFNAQLKILELNRDITQKSDELKGLEPGTEDYYKKENELRQIQINYYESRGNLTQQEQIQIQFLKDCNQINDYYIAGDKDAARAKKVNTINPATGESLATVGEIEYENADFWGRLGMDTGTFACSFAAGVVSVSEAIIDGGVTLAGGIASLFPGNNAQWAEDFVSINFVNDAYDGLVLAGVLNSESAYSSVHDVGKVAGTIFGYASLSWLPGGKITTAALGGLSAGGNSSQQALNSGATFKEAVITGLVAGTAGAIAGSFVSGYSSDVVGLTSLKEVGLITLKGIGFSIAEPVVNSVTEYHAYANRMTDAEGNKLYDNVFDYVSGGLANILMAGAAGAFSVGLPGLKSYGNYKNVYNTLNKLDDISEGALEKFGKRFNKLSKEQQSSVFDNITTESTLISYSKKCLKYTDGPLEDYVKQLKSEATSSAKKTLANRDKIIEQIESNFYISDEDLKLLEYSKKEIIRIRHIEKLDFDDAVTYIKENTKTFDEIYKVKLKNSLSSATETLYATKLMYDNGAYTISHDEVLKKRMAAKNKEYVQGKKIMKYNAKGELKDLTEWFPGCDEFISDEWLLDYTKKLAKISDAQIEAYAKAKNLMYSNIDEKFIATAAYLEDHPVKIKGTIYQTATKGGANFETFGGALGNMAQIQLENINITGGAYTLLADDVKMAKNFPDCCKLGSDGKLEITDMELFGKKALSGVSLSNVDGVYKFEVEVELNSKNISMPSINNGAMYTEYGIPGGYLLSGELETVISGTKIGTDFFKTGGKYNGNGKVIEGYLLKGGKE